MAESVEAVTESVEAVTESVAPVTESVAPVTESVAGATESYYWSVQLATGTQITKKAVILFKTLPVRGAVSHFNIFFCTI